MAALLQAVMITQACFRHGANPDKLTARCQFYIVQNKNGIPRLDNKYTVYGKVIKGMDVVDHIVNLPRNKEDAPLTPVTMNVNIIKLKAKALKKMGWREF